MLKTQRLFHVLELLKSGEKFQLSDIAVACKISERTINRDINALIKLGFAINVEDGYSLESHFSRPLPGQFNDIELRLIRFALETHQLGAVFPFSDLADRLAGTMPTSHLQFGLGSEKQSKFFKKENDNRLFDKSANKSRWLTNEVDE